MPATRYATIGLVVLAFVSAAVAVRVAHGVLQRLLDALEIVGAQNRAAVQTRARQLIRALTLLAYGVAALASLSLALGRFGVNEPQWDPRLFAHWFLTHGVNLISSSSAHTSSCAPRTWRLSTCGSSWPGGMPRAISSGNGARRRLARS